MKFLIGIFTVLITTTSFAEEKIKMNFLNEEIPKIVEFYSKASGQKFILDATVRGKVTILNPSEVSLDEAFSLISEGLAINGYAVVKNGDVFTVKNARSAQRDNIQVSSEVPTAKPQRMATWVINLKNITANDVQKDLRLLTSSYGELAAVANSNQLVITDWTSNLQRVAELIKQVDKPMDPSVAKLVAQSLKERKETREVKIIKNKDGETQKTETTEK